MSSSSEPPRSTMETHIFEIASYSLSKSVVKFNECLSSSTFIVAGRKWEIEFYPNGIGSTVCVAAGIRLFDVMEDVEVKASVRLMLMNWRTSKWISQWTTGLLIFNQDICRHTDIIFIGQSDFEKSNYLKDDMLKIKCVLCVAVPSELKNIPKDAQPEDKFSDIIEYYGQSMKSGVSADVKFLVQERTFPAHRWVLAACSPVFKKSFFDTQINEGDKIQEIIVTNMEADTFNSLLYFIYAESMPNEENISKKESTLTTQRLLVAADRYEIYKLKSICVDKLCQGLTVDTVATTLVVAEEHNCRELRALCIEFLLNDSNHLGQPVTGSLDDRSGDAQLS